MRRPQLRWNAAQAVVPPGEFLRRLREQAESVHEAHFVDHAAHRGALGLRDVDLSRPALRVVDIAVLGCDVEVADHREPRMSLQFF